MSANDRSTGFAASLERSMPARAGGRFVFGAIVGAILISVAGLAGLAGCAHYQLGTGAAPTFHTLYVAPVANKTLLPQSQAILATQVREAFVRDGRVTLVNSAAAAEATLSVVITDYHRDIRVVREGDTGLARKYDLTLGVTCALRDNRTGTDILANRLVSAQREAFTDGGQLQSEYQALPLLAETVAGKLVHAALDVW